MAFYTLVWWSAFLVAAAAFTCDGDRELPDSHVADDYCDCVDGLDEVSTGACADTKYICKNLPHQPKEIFSSRVNDGICDCCDGSDEWRSASLCANECVEGAKAGMLELTEGLREKAVRSHRGVEAMQDRAKRIDAARSALASGEESLTAAKRNRERAEAIEAARRKEREARRSGGEIAVAFRLGDMSDDLLKTALARLTLAKQVRNRDQATTARRTA